MKIKRMSASQAKAIGEMFMAYANVMDLYLGNEHGPDEASKLAFHHTVMRHRYVRQFLTVEDSLQPAEPHTVSEPAPNDFYQRRGKVKKLTKARAAKGYNKLANAWAYLTAAYWTKLPTSQQHTHEINDTFRVLIDCARKVRVEGNL